MMYVIIRKGDWLVSHPFLLMSTIWGEISVEQGIDYHSSL